MSQAFWSYVHKDDAAENERISRLAKDVVEEYKMLTGDPIELFLDKDGIAWGDEWRKKIDENLASVEFFIPVMTPRYFKSSECRSELNQFLQAADKLGRLELLLPLYYVDVLSLNNDGPVEDSLLSRVRDFQYQDWRELRFMDVTSEAYRRGVNEMAIRLVEANKRLEEVSVDEAAPELDRETREEEDDTPGIMDRLATAEEAGAKITDTLMEIAGQIHIIGEVMKEATSDIAKASGGQGVFARRIQIIRVVATKLTGPTDKISMLTNQFEPQLHSIDDGIRIIIELAPAEIAENPAMKQNFCSYIESIRGLSGAAHDGLSNIGGMVEAVTPIERMSRDLRPVLRRLRQALTIMAESSGTSDNWVGLIEDSGIDCR